MYDRIEDVKEEFLWYAQEFLNYPDAEVKAIILDDDSISYSAIMYSNQRFRIERKREWCMALVMGKVKESDLPVTRITTHTKDKYNVVFGSL